MATPLSRKAFTATRRSGTRKYMAPWATLTGSLFSVGDSISRTPAQSTLPEMDALWDRAKAAERGGA